MADRDSSRPGIIRRRIGPAFDDTRPTVERVKAAATAAGVASAVVAAGIAGGDAASIALAHHALSSIATTDVVTALATGGGAMVLTGFLTGADVGTEPTSNRIPRRTAHHRVWGHLRTVLGIGAVTTGVAAAVTGVAPGLGHSAAEVAQFAIGMGGAAVGTEITRRVIGHGLTPTPPAQPKALE